MITETIKIQNLKCGGCAKTIKDQLSALPGAIRVEVDEAGNTVLITHEDSLEKHLITERLMALGYPEEGDNNNILTKAKSYGSCMIGRLTKDEE